MALTDEKKKNLAVIFDMDGVLIDSTEYIWESFRQLLKPYGIKVTDELIKECLGRSLKDQLKLWEEKFSVKLPALSEFAHKAAVIQIEMMKESVVEKELTFLLDDLEKNHFKLAIGTSSEKTRADQILDLLGVKKYFDAIITADDVAEHKPNPHVHLEAAKRIKVSPRYCVVIEDAATGIEAARRAGMKSIGYITKYNSPEDLKDADLLIKSFSELSVKKIKGLFD